LLTQNVKFFDNDQNGSVATVAVAVVVMSLSLLFSLLLLLSPIDLTFFPVQLCFFSSVNWRIPLAVQSRPDPSKKFSTPGKLKSPTRTTDDAVVVVVVLVVVGVDWWTSLAVESRPDPFQEIFYLMSSYKFLKEFTDFAALTSDEKLFQCLAAQMLKKILRISRFGLANSSAKCVADCLVMAPSTQTSFVR
jgi:hypothetical protein